MRLTRFLSLVLALAFVISSRSEGSSAYYLTAGDNGTNWIVQGNSAVAYGQNQATSGGEYAIAVGSTVRTLHNGNSSTGFGSEYDLSGNFLGVNYPYPVSGAAFYDGTRDGQNNYSVDYFTGNVYSFDLNWANPTLLFDSGLGGFNTLGITFDSGTNSLWVSTWGADSVVNYSLAGAALSSFSTGFSSITSLAYDSTDGTLWMGSQGQQGTFWQYNTAGGLLGSTTYAQLVLQNTLGGEFAYGASVVTPEPSTLAMFAVAGLVGIGRVVRRRKQA